MFRIQGLGCGPFDIFVAVNTPLNFINAQVLAESFHASPLVTRNNFHGAGILPAMTDAEALEAAAVQSLAGSFVSERWRRRSYRAPHHTASAVALVGGGCHFHLKTRRYTHRRD
jgi:hypothetical protein